VTHSIHYAPPVSRPPSPPALALTALAGILLALGAWHFGPHQGDDGFIFLRYAERLAGGHGLGFSDGLPPVEGFSSPLWLLLLAGLIALGLPSLVAMQVLSALSFGALLAGLWLLVRALGGTPLQAGLAWLGLALLRPPLFWAFAGLETPLVAALLLFTAWGLVVGRSRHVAPAGLLGVVRPEGPALAALAVGLGAWRERRWPTPLEVAGVMGPTVAWFVLRLIVYGDVLPNTFYAKATGAPIAQLSRGIAYAGMLTPAVLMLGIAWWLGRKIPQQDDDPVRDDRAMPAVLALAGAHLAIVIGGGGDWMWFGRLLVPVLVLVLAALVTMRPGLPRWVSIAAILGLIPHISPITTWMDIRAFEPLPAVAFQEGGLTGAEAAAGRWIAAHGQPGQLIAVNHAGALPWAAPEQDILDMTGLLDEHIAHHATGGLHDRYDVDHVLASQPDWVVLHSRSPLGADGAVLHADYWSGETALLEDERFQQHYRPVGAAWSWEWVAEGTSYTTIYRRVEAPGL